jgi:hypothetical protein
MLYIYGREKKVKENETCQAISSEYKNVIIE